MAACDLLGSFYQRGYVRKLPQPPCFYYQPALSAVKKPNKIRSRYRSTNAHRFFAAETQHSITPSTGASQECTSCHGSSSVVPTDLAVKAHAQCVAKVLIHTHVRAAPFGTSAMRSVHTPQHSNAANMVAPYLVTVAKRSFNVARRFNPYMDFQSHSLATFCWLVTYLPKRYSCTTASKRTQSFGFREV